DLLHASAGQEQVETGAGRVGAALGALVRGERLVVVGPGPGPVAEGLLGPGQIHASLLEVGVGAGQLGAGLADLLVACAGLGSLPARPRALARPPRPSPRPLARPGGGRRCGPSRDPPGRPPGGPGPAAAGLSAPALRKTPARRPPGPGPPR